MDGLWFILDLIVVAVIAICIFSSVKRGFVRTVIEVVGYFLALYISFTLSGAIATSVYENKIEPAVIDAVVDNVKVATDTTADAAIDAVWETLPEAVKKSAAFFGVDKDNLTVDNELQLGSAVNTREIAKNVCQNAIKPIALGLIKSLVGMVLFIVLSVLVKMLARFVNKLFKLPIIGGLNKALGGVVGFAKGIIFSMVICVAVSTFIAFTGEGFWFFTKENIDRSLIFGLLANIIKF